jgi:hypothetical protein
VDLIVRDALIGSHSDKIAPDAQRALRRIADKLSAGPEVRATIESAMALPGKWRAEANKQRQIAQSPTLSEDKLAWHAALAQKGHADANELEAIFGPAPPATDAPDARARACGFDSLDDALRHLEMAAGKATPPAGGDAVPKIEWPTPYRREPMQEPPFTRSLFTAQQVEEIVRRLASGGGASDAMREAVERVKFRLHFDGWPAESFWNAGTEESPRWIPDWRYEIALIEHALHGTPITQPEKPTDTKPRNEIPDLGWGARVGQEWQPIETAPKDGSLFLGWVSAERWSSEDGGGSGRSADTSEVDFCQWRNFETGGVYENMMGQIGDVQDFTHWMPLPAAPAPETQG